MDLLIHFMIQYSRFANVDVKFQASQGKICQASPAIHP